VSYVHAATLADIPDGGSLGVTIDGTDLCLVRDGDEVYAIFDECSHAQIALSEGDVDGCEIECWLHGSRFDVRTGKPVNLPAVAPVQTYPTTIEGDVVLVELGLPEGNRPHVIGVS
jgi:3-phenylpropionate/trans-cinnamate dioxygenase ferredoxin subunit